jgi:hypothetical protein
MGFIRSIPIAAFLAVMITCSSGCAMLGFTPGASEPIVMVPVEDPVQKTVAIHEMAHAVIQSILFDPEQVGAVHVHTKVCRPYDEDYCCDTPDKRHYGGVEQAGEGFWSFFGRGPQYYRDRAVLYLAGPVADRVLNGIDPTEYERIDTELAEDKIRSALRIEEQRRKVAGRGRMADIPRRTVEQELAIARARAERLVRANALLIQELGERLAETSPDAEGTRRISGDLLRQFLAKRKLRNLEEQ